MNRDLLAEIEKVFLKRFRIKDIGFDICFKSNKYKNYENSEKIITAFEKSNKQKPEYAYDDFEAFKEVYLNTNNIELKALLGYIIGINKHNLKENSQLVKDTIEYLFSITDKLCLCQNADSNYRKISEYIGKAIELTEVFGKKENSIYHQKINYIKFKILSIYKILPIATLELMEILFKKGGEKHFFSENDDNNISEEIFAIIIEIINNLSDEILKLSYTFDYEIIEKVYNLKIQIYNKKNNKERGKESYIKLAEYLREYAIKKKNVDPTSFEFRDNYFRIKILQKSMKYYEIIGDKESKNFVKKQIDKLNLQKSKNMKSIEFSINTTRFLNNDGEKLVGKSLIQTLIFCGFRFGNYILNVETKEKFEREVYEYSQTLLGMVSKDIIDKNGNIVFKLKGLNSNNPQEDKELFQQYVYHTISQEENFVGVMFMGYYDHIQEEFLNISIKDIEILVDKNKFIPEDRKEIFKKGLVYGLKGQWLEFLSLMCPQIENFYREIIVLCGGTDNKYNQDFTQQEYYTLGSVLDNEILNEYYEENIILILKAILNEKAGANLRNRVAHGLTNDTDANSGISVWLLFFVITLCCWYNPTAYEIFGELNYKENEIQ